jgi:hypothetical protein
MRQINGFGHSPFHRRNPMVPARRVADLKPRTMGEQDRFRAIVRDLRELVSHIRINQDTMRLAMVLPTWSNFVQTSYYRHMSSCLTSDMIRKYRAWWELVLEATEHRKDDRAAFGFALAVFAAERVNRGGGPVQVVRGERFGLSPEREAAMREAVLTRFESLAAS